MRLTIASATVTLFLASGALAQTPLSEEELRQTFLGKKVEWANVGITEYKPDGTFEFYSLERRQTYRGKVTFKPGIMCYGAGANSEPCDQIYRDPKGIYLKSPRGNISYARFQ